MTNMRTGNNAPIGVFDSGLGGLTVVREIMRNLPDEDIVYFGDTARVPYGSKSPETIIRYSRQIIRFLEQQQVKAIVIACNTASALALDTVEKETSLPVLGVVRPGADMAVSSTRNGRIGVIATEGTIRSGLYNRLIREADPQLQVFTKACPLFVPLVEEGWTRDPITEEVARRYLKELLENEIDTLIMGCTHYPLLRSLLKDVVGDGVQLINPAYETAQVLGKLLDDKKMRHAPVASEEEPGRYRYYASDSAEHFRDFANRILPHQVIEAELVAIENF